MKKLYKITALIMGIAIAVVSAVCGGLFLAIPVLCVMMVVIVAWVVICRRIVERRRRRRAGALLAGSIVLLAVLIHSAVNIYALAKVREEMRRIEERGEPTSLAELVREPVPDDQNAASVYERAFAILRANQGGLREVVLLHDESPPSLGAEKKISRGDAQEYLAEASELFQLLHEARSRPQCDFKVDYTEWARAPEVRHLLNLRTCVQLLSVKAALELEQGQKEKALATVLDGFATAGASAGGRCMVSSLIRISCDNIMLDRLESVLVDIEVAEQDYQALYEWLHNEREASVVDLEGERCFVMAQYGGTEEESLGLLFESFDDTDSSSWLLDPANYLEGRIKGWYLGSYLHRPLLNLEYSRFLGKMAELIKADRLSYWEYKQMSEFSVGDMPGAGSEFGTIVPAVLAALTREAMLDARLGAAELALAVRMYRSKSGNYPSRLDELVPSIIDELPLDPFSGKSYVYRREGDDCIVYSLGENAEDDDGARENGDIVWRCEE